MSTKPSLQETIEELYKVFASYPLADHVDGCPHCVFEPDHVQIHSAPLRALSAEELEKYAFKALSTWGDSNDYRHFLPRIFELQAQNVMEPTYVETTFGKLDYASWQTWPTQEQEAIRRYFMALWVDVLDARPVDEELSNTEASSYLCAISCASEDLESYLVVWTEGQLTYKRDHFLATVNWFGETLYGQEELTGGFWEPKPSAQVRKWFARPKTWQAFGLKFPPRGYSSD